MELGLHSMEVKDKMTEVVWAQVAEVKMLVADQMVGVRPPKDSHAMSEI